MRRFLVSAGDCPHDAPVVLRSSDFCCCRERGSDLTPWSIQEIERVVYGASAALKDAVAVFGSEAAVMFAVKNAARTGLSALVRLFRLF